MIFLILLVAEVVLKKLMGVVGVDGKDLIGSNASIEFLVSKEGEIVSLHTPVSLTENCLAYEIGKRNVSFTF